VSGGGCTRAAAGATSALSSANATFNGAFLAYSSSRLLVRRRCECWQGAKAVCRQLCSNAAAANQDLKAPRWQLIRTCSASAKTQKQATQHLRVIPLQSKATTGQLVGKNVLVQLHESSMTIFIVPSGWSTLL
jgi:hypothetical protein